MSLTVDVAGRTDVGCVRKNNEDNLGYDTRYGIFVVCDGMGGAAAGEVASKMAVDTILHYYRDSARAGKTQPAGTQSPSHSERANALANAVQSANAAIFQESHKDTTRAGMGSTIVAVSVEKNHYSIAHVGDSRIYLIRNGEIQQLTNDHSLVMEQVRRGIITPEEAKKVDYHNIVIRALGAEPTVETDLDDMLAQENDTLVLCSDGLTRHVDDQKILEIVTKAESLDAAVAMLIETAKQGGGADNVTAMLLKFRDQSWVDGLIKGLVPGNAKVQDSI